jgi:hypothetical protein
MFPKGLSEKMAPKACVHGIKPLPHSASSFAGAACSFPTWTKGEEFEISGTCAREPPPA